VATVVLIGAGIALFEHLMGIWLRTGSLDAH